MKYQQNNLIYAYIFLILMNVFTVYCILNS